MSRRTHVTEWESSPVRELSKIFGGQCTVPVSKLSCRKKTGESDVPAPLVDSEEEGWDIDELARRFSKKNFPELNERTRFTLCSVDALFFKKKEWVFVEFKDDDVVCKENEHTPRQQECDESDLVVFNNTPRNYRAWIQRKLYDTEYMFTRYGKQWDYKEAIAYIVVKHGPKNPLPRLHNGPAQFARHIQNVVYQHYDLFPGMHYLYRQIHLVDEITFKNLILQELSPNFES